MTRTEILHYDPSCRTAALAACVAVLIRTSVAYAQSPTALEQAELGGLSPELRAQVQARAVSGNSVTEVLQAMLLNNIKIKHPAIGIQIRHPATQIAAVDWEKGVAVVKSPAGRMQVVRFDTETLKVK